MAYSCWNPLKVRQIQKHSYLFNCEAKQPQNVLIFISSVTIAAYSKKLAKKITKPTSWAQIFRRCCVERMTLRCVIASFASLRHLRRRWQTYDHVLSRQMYSQKEVLVFIFYLPPMMVCPFTTKKNEVMTLPTGDQCFDTNGHCVNGNAAHRIACLRLVTLSNSVGLWFSLAVLKDSPLL